MTILRYVVNFLYWPSVSLLLLYGIYYWSDSVLFKAAVPISIISILVEIARRVR